MNKNAVDPSGRKAIGLTFVNEASRPGRRQFFYVDPDDYELLASGVTAKNTGECGRAVVTRRDLVSSVPAAVVSELGTTRTPRTVWK